MAQLSKKILAAVVATGVAAAGAGYWWKKSHHNHSLQGEGIIANTDGPFEVSSCSARLHQDSPALSIAFTQGVESNQAIDKLVQVYDLGIDKKNTNIEIKAISKEAEEASKKPLEGSWISPENPHVLVFPYVKAGHKYKIDIAQSLKSQVDKLLPSHHTCEVVSDEMSPSFFFASKGTVLPAGLNGGLPVVTVNVPEVDVEFLRVAPESMPKFFELVAGRFNPNRAAAQEESGDADSEGNEYDEGYNYYGYSTRNKFKGATSGWDLNQLESLSKSVYQNRFVMDEKQNKRNINYLPVEKIAELKEPGVYVAVMRRPGKFEYDYQTTYFYVSDIGLHLRSQSKATDVFTTSLKEGTAISGVEIEVLGKNGKALLKGKTNGDGHAAIDSLPTNAFMLIAKRGKELSVVPLKDPALDLSEFDLNGYTSSDTKIFAWSGRDLYRPGENFTLSAIIRKADGTPAEAIPISAELRKPNGSVVSSWTWQPDEKTAGYYQDVINLPPDADTGNWSITLKTDPNARKADERFVFYVEEFVPERMKMDLKAKEGVIIDNQALQITVQGDYLYGAPAAGNRILGNVFQARSEKALPKQWPDFVFGDASEKSFQNTPIEETVLDGKGAGEFNIAYQRSQASPLEIRTSFSLLESGGRPVVRSISRQWWPASTLIAVRPEFEGNVSNENSLVNFEVIRVNSKGDFVPTKQANFKLVQEHRDYYWRQENGSWHSGYTEYEETTQNGAIQLSKRTKIALPVKWGTYRLDITDPETGLVMKYRFYAGWNAQSDESLGNRPDRVRLQLENVPAKAGDDIKVKIIPPHDGEALIMVEGGKVLWSKRTSVSTKGTTVTVPIEKGWNRGDLYVSTVVFRPASQGDRITPTRAVGFAWIPLKNEDRKLKVNLNVPNQVEPEKRTTAKLKVEGQAGKKVMATVYAVDVGILNITNFKTPDPFDFFFGKHEYGAELYDIYGKIIERMDGTAGKIKWGGDAGKRDSQSMPKKVKLVDLFSGPVQLNDKGEADIPLNIPDFNGTLRVMAIATTENAFGSSDKEMMVTAPIVAELSMPRFISMGDESTLALDVTNMLPGEQNITINIGSDSLLRINESEKNVKLANKQRQIFRFNLAANEPYGLSKITLDVKTAGDKPIKIHREFALQIQPPVPREEDSKRIRIEAGSNYTIESNMLDRFYKGSATFSVSASSKPPINVRNVVKGLLDYPYGCLEQTTSAAYPHVFIDEAGAKAVGLKPHTRNERTKFIEGAMSRIASLQGPDGGYRLWDGNSGSYEHYLTAYVTSFLLDAKDAGFNVPDNMLSKSKKWMESKLNASGNIFTQVPSELKLDANGGYDYRDYDLIRVNHQRFAEVAHMAYLLAREEKASLASLRVLHDTYRNRAKSPLALVHLGLALKLMGDEKRAEVALNEAMSKPYGIRNAQYEWLGDYGSPMRDKSMAYALLVRHKVNHPQRENLIMDVAQIMDNNGRWYSTQERISLYLAARAAGGDSKEAWEASIRQGENTIALKSKDTETRAFEPQAVSKGITIENKGTQALWVELAATGFPIKVIPPKMDHFTVKREWFTLDGKPWKGGNLKVGEMLIARVTASSKYITEDAMIVDHIPSGMEVENLNISQGAQAGQFMVDGMNIGDAMNHPSIKHKEYRDDRFVSAVRLEKNPLQLYYLLRIVTPGRFNVPGTFVEDMYRPNLRTYGAAGEMITITDKQPKS